MKISDNGMKLIQSFEGLYLKAYKDRVGVWTIGWGTTNCDRSITGTTIKRGLTISRSTAEKWLRKSLDTKYGPKVSKYDDKYHWTQNEYDALVSFAYNLGHIDQLTDNGKRSRAQICDAWLKYDKAGGKHVKGLQDRRQAELKLFRKLTPSVVGNPYPSPTVTIASKAQGEAIKLTNWTYHGDMVKAVQWEFVRLGYDLGKPAVDGECGPKTVAAILSFQMGSGLKADGLCGAKTWAALIAAKKKPVPAQATPAKEDKVKAVAAVKEVDHLALVVAGCKEIYPLSIGRTHGKGVQKKVKSLAKFKKQKRLNCHLMVSLVMQRANLLDEGVVVTHTAKRNGKKCIDDAMNNWQKLKNCKVHWVNKKYKDLPAKYKKAGMIYYQNSNACISAGDGKIYSCNRPLNYRYKKKGDYLRKTGYPFGSRILVVVEPLTVRA